MPLRTAARETLPDASVVLRSERFTLVLKPLATDVLLMTGIGYEDGAVFDLLVREIESAAARAQPRMLKLFCDLSEETGMASDSRERWGRWVKETRYSNLDTHLLVRSRLVDMAVSLITLFVSGPGTVRSYSDPTKLEAAIRQVVPGFRGLPRYPELAPVRAR